MSRKIDIANTFSGPMDLLLHLIRRDEMDIHDIPIARLTRQYLAEIDGLGLVDLEEATEFLDLASRLVEIKGRLLLPPEETPANDDSEEEVTDLDPRSGLVEALLEYRQLKEASRLLDGLAEEQEKRFPHHLWRQPELSLGEDTPDPVVLDAAALFTAVQALLEKIKPLERVQSEIPLAHRIQQIGAVLTQTGKTRFSHLLSDNANRQEIVAFFIAVLEMLRQGVLTARQNGTFADLVLEKASPPRVSTPVWSARRPLRPSGKQKNRPARRPVFPAATPPRPQVKSARLGQRPRRGWTAFPPSAAPATLRPVKPQGLPTRFFC